MNNMIYLDYNATSPLHPDVNAAMHAVEGVPLNPSSIHAAGRAARKIKEEARAKLMEFVGAQALVFCGSGTEANNMALLQKPKNIITNVEHESVFKAAVDPIIISVDEGGLVKLDQLEAALKDNENALVSIILANNETGIVQKMKPISALTKQYGAMLHIDAVQAFGKIRLNMVELGADLMTICPHKVGGPVGTAALCHRADIELIPFMKGGGQEKNKRPSTENVVAIAGFAATIELGIMSEAEAEPAMSLRSGVLSEEQARRGTIKELRDYFEGEILKITPDTIIHGKDSPRLPNTSNISMPNMEAATQLIHFDSKKVCVSAGSACSSGKIEESRILKEMGVKNSKNAVRVSIGWNTSKTEIDQFIEVWAELYQRAR